MYIKAQPPMAYERLGGEAPDEAFEDANMEDVPDIAAQVTELSASQARLEDMQVS